MEIDFEKLFNEEEIEKVKNEMEEYLPTLFAQNRSIENMTNIMKIFDAAFLPIILHTLPVNPVHSPSLLPFYY